MSSSGKRRVKKAGRKKAVEELDSRAGPPSPLAPTPVLKKKKKKSIASRLREEEAEYDPGMFNTGNKYSSNYAREGNLSPEKPKPIKPAPEKMRPGKVEESKKNEKNESDTDGGYSDEGFEDYQDDDFEDPVDDDEMKQEKVLEKSRFETITPISPEKKKKPSSRNQFAPELHKRPASKDTKGSGGGFGKVERPVKRNNSSESQRRNRVPSKVTSSSQKFTDNKIGVNIGSRSGSKRCKDLKSLLSLTKQKNDVFEIHSMQPWEFYMRSLASKGSKRQTFTQTGDDNKEMETQTENIATATVGVNFPNDDEAAPSDDEEEEKLNTKAAEELLDMVKVCEILIMEEQQYRSQFDEDEEDECGGRALKAIGQRCVQLGDEVDLEGRLVIDITFCMNQPNTLLSVHSRKFSSDTSSPDSKACLCLWNVYEPAIPQTIILCDGIPTKAVLSPDIPSICIVGTEEGSLHVWDLRKRDLWKSNELQPSYSTDGISSMDKNHGDCICDMQVLSSPIKARTELTSSSLSFQIASLDETGILHIWTVVEVSITEDANSFEHTGEKLTFDSGLALGERIKLVHSSRINVFDNLKQAAFQQSVTGLTFCTDDFGHFLVSCQSGDVVRCSRFGQKCTPNTFQISPDNHITGIISTGTCATCIDINPFLNSLFLAGYSDGKLALFNVESSIPLRIWESFTTPGDYGTGQAPIIKVSWSKSCPLVFFVLDEKQTLHLWDLSEDSELPVVSERISEDDGHQSKSLICLSSNSVRASGNSIAIASGNLIRVQNIKRRYSRKIPLESEAKTVMNSI